ncbi:hypothetical protein PHAVU_003G262100 [Phaseolus vulgaris]|uniref:Chalcone-flavanone isomerase family protein n=1 Tax=Phaseolus vulgaris TaxID=3885 RepID=V7CFM2_PHAVU|nr:hypothetical protein PHAVU_003G262100g [Phaseolus vulgaris]ESW28138.1 hypothetical protein PHAVU_003G262100g [Phaseolus vulgaris]
METPSSTARRVTRSQTTSNNIPLSRKKNEDSEMAVSKTQQRKGVQNQDRCALIDISNDSPIVGLANGNDLETPLSSMAKQKRVKKTPGSGEALLRGQVKTLLQKVEEEAVISKLTMEVISPFLQIANSPMSLLAPTPANTPQIPNLSGPNGDALALVSPPSCVIEEQLITRVVNEIFEKNKEVECEKSVITRSLLLDFSDKSEVVSECSSVTHGSGVSTEDDGASVWSMQVNASTHDEDEMEEESGEEEEEGDYYEDAEEEDDGGLLLDELCAGLNNISVNEKGCGKHTRFVYDSEDELVEKVVESCASSDVVHLKGLPTPKGKHLRFPEEEEENCSV